MSSSAHARALIEERNKMIDVVIVTLLRPTLRQVCNQVNNVIPDPNLILVTERGSSIGELRNQGLAKVTSEFVAFIDDDILIRDNFADLISFLKTHPDYDCVFGEPELGFTLGCSLFRTARLKAVGGFPMLDSLIVKDRPLKAKILSGVYCDHLVSRPFDVIKHSWYWMWHGFNTESRFGFLHNPKECVSLFFKSLFVWRKPAIAFCYLFWFVKAGFAYPLMALW
jgi:glycosyltransferase involved in cell wall biosynthesis